MNKIQEIIKQFKTSNFFRNTIISYFLIGCVTMILFSGIIVWNIKNVSIKQINDINLTMLTQAANTGKLIIEDICNKFFKEFSNNSVIISAMRNSELSLQQRSSLQTLFQNYLSENSVLGSISVYNLKNNLEFTVYSEKYADEQKIKDIDMAERLRNFKPNDEMIFARCVRTDLKQQNDIDDLKYITIVFRIDNSSALVVNIDQKRFDKLINLSSHADIQQTVVLNNRHNIISGAANEFSAEQMQQISRLISNSEQPVGSFSFNNKLINYVKSSYLDYIYINIYDAKQLPGAGKHLIFFIVCSAIILTLLNLLLGIFCSQKLYRPVKKIVNTFYKKRLSEIEKNNELDLIFKDISKLRSDFNSLQRVENKYILAQRNRLLREVLLGNITPHDKFYDDLLAECSIKFVEDYFTIITFKIDWNNLEPNIETDIEPDLLQYAVMNIGCELLSDICPVFTVEMENTFILNHAQNCFANAEAEQALTDTVKNIQTYIENYFNITVTMVIGESTVSLSDVSTAFNHAKYAELYSLVYEPASVIYYRDVIKRTEIDAIYPRATEKKIIEALRTEDFNEVGTNITKFINELKELEYNKIFFFVTQLILDLGKACKEIYNTDAEIPDISIADMINEIETLDEIKDILFNYCKDITENQTYIEVDKKDAIAKSIIDYVEQNYRDPALNIDMIASKFGYSTNYVRSIFKNACNISLSTYINDKRFEEIYRMLKQTNLSVKDICEMVGLKYGGYFHTAFKKRTGFTPDKYRMLHKKD